jgi:hypothetical protein
MSSLSSTSRIMFSPVKPPRLVHAAHVRREVQSFVVPDDPEDPGLTLADFWKELNYSPEDFKDYDLSDHWSPKKDFGQYMNEISESLFESFDLGAYLLKSLVV